MACKGFQRPLIKVLKNKVFEGTEWNISHHTEIGSQHTPCIAALLKVICVPMWGTDLCIYAGGLISEVCSVTPCLLPLSWGYGTSSNTGKRRPLGGARIQESQIQWTPALGLEIKAPPKPHRVRA